MKNTLKELFDGCTTKDVRRAISANRINNVISWLLKHAFLFLKNFFALAYLAETE